MSFKTAEMFQIGDWFMLRQVGRNVDSYFNTLFVSALCKELQPDNDESSCNNSVEDINHHASQRDRKTELIEDKKELVKMVELA